MNNTIVNPIAVKSKAMFQWALLDLLAKEHYSKITITSLSLKADLARRTFYRHYDTVEDVLLEIIESQYDDYLVKLESLPSLRLSNITEAFFEFWFDRIGFLNTLKQNNLIPYFYDGMNLFIPKIYDILKGYLNEFCDEETLRYGLYFSIGGHFNILMLHVNENSIKKPSEMKAIIQRVYDSVKM